MDRVQDSTSLRRERAATCGHGAFSRGAFSHGAFSLVELVIVLGVIMILMGLFVPALSGSISQAKLTRDMSLMRQHAAMITQYTADSGGVFPFYGEYESPELAAQLWSKPMLAAGYYSSIEQIDPDIEPDGTLFSIALSMCMVYDWRLMRPGHTVPFEEQVAVPVQERAVRFPALKGLVFRHFNGLSIGHTDFRSFCCTDLWEFPVGMADGSAESGNYADFNGDKPLWIENDIGKPVYTTWLGVTGIDG